MQGYNLIAVLSPDRSHMLMCRRRKAPYQGLLNLVGGKIEPGESDGDAAYREMQEETAITAKDIRLLHLLDFTYPLDGCYVQVYAGVLRAAVTLQEEVNALLWVPLEGEDFFSMARYAGEGNIGHIVEHIRMNWDRILQA